MKRLMILVFVSFLSFVEPYHIDKQEALKMYKKLNQIRSCVLAYQLKHPGLKLPGIKKIGLHKYKWSPQLAIIAEKRVVEMIENNQRAGHNSHIENIDQYTRCTGYSRNTSKKDHIFHYILDRNVPSRGHRKALLSKEYTRVGIGFGVSGNKYWSCVILD